MHYVTLNLTLILEKANIANKPRANTVLLGNRLPRQQMAVGSMLRYATPIWRTKLASITMESRGENGSV